MHPLKQYLYDVDERMQDFAERVGVSRQTLYRIISGVQAPKPMLARRIEEATGGAVTIGMLYGGDASGSADSVSAIPQGDGAALDQERVKLAIAVAVNHLRPQPSLLPPAKTLDVAVEAVVNTYTALRKLTTRQGPSRLAQAVRPVLEEMLKETGSAPTSAALDHGAALAAELYHQA